MKTCVIGIDLGTSSCKVLALNAAGTVLAAAGRDYPLFQPQRGYSEQLPEDWWRETAAALQDVTRQVSADRIAGVSFSGQMHGMVALDAARRVVRPAILWNDQRTQAQCDEITAAAGGPDGLLKQTNNMMLTGYTGGKILWMKQNEPARYEETALVLLPKDYLRYRLTGELVTDVSDASGTGLYDVKNRAWQHALIERIGLRRELFPPVVESVAQTGFVTAEAAAQTGLLAGTPVFGGGGDAVVSAIAAGLDGPERISVTLGTSGVVAATLPRYMDNPGGKLQLFCNNLPGTYMAFGCTLSAAGSYQWFVDQFGTGAQPFEQLETLAASVPAGADGLVFLPYLTGERCPLFDPDAAGGFVGIRAGMHRGHFARAVMEGVCCSLRQVYELCVTSSGAHASSLVVSGGGAKSALWRQILADVFGMRADTVNSSAHGGAYGAALLAGIGCSLWETAEQAVSTVKTVGQTNPQPQNAAAYARLYSQYGRLYGSLKWFFSENGGRPRAEP